MFPKLRFCKEILVAILSFSENPVTCSVFKLTCKLGLIYNMMETSDAERKQTEVEEIQIGNENRRVLLL